MYSADLNLCIKLFTFRIGLSSIPSKPLCHIENKLDIVFKDYNGIIMDCKSAKRI